MRRPAPLLSTLQWTDLSGGDARDRLQEAEIRQSIADVEAG
jgi:hypothetical protein